MQGAGRGRGGAGEEGEGRGQGGEGQERKGRGGAGEEGAGGEHIVQYSNLTCVHSNTKVSSRQESCKLLLCLVHVEVI